MCDFQGWIIKRQSDNRIRFHLEKEEDSDTDYHMVNLEDIMLSEIS